MKTREEVIGLIEKQLDSCGEIKPKGCNKAHYGRCELEQLINFIYGSYNNKKNLKPSTLYKY